MCFFLVATLAFFFLYQPAPAEEFWAKKAAAEWTQEEALSLLTDSPWAKRVTVLHATGRFVEEVREEERGYVTGQGKPKFRSVVKVGQTRPELMEAAYTVRLSSAAILQQAWERLRQIAPQAMVDLLPPPPDPALPEHVVTVQVSRPPAWPAVHLFQGLSDQDLLERARLQTGREELRKPARVVLHGLGAGESVSFYFSRPDELPKISARTSWVEFVFEREGGEKLKARFDLKR